MTALRIRDVTYGSPDDPMTGMLVSPDIAGPLPTILLFPDAFGLGDDALTIARRLAESGRAVFAADVWGGRLTRTSMAEIGPLIGGLVAGRSRWLSRLSAAHDAAVSQPEVDADAVVALGYCVGGSGVLEHLRSGAALRGAIGVHPGLDLLSDGWHAAVAGASVLIVTGAEDPMATATQREALTTALSGASIEWELDVYSDTVHAFTSPRSIDSPDPSVIAYHPRSAARAWAATTRFLAETLGGHDHQR